MSVLNNRSHVPRTVAPAAIRPQKGSTIPSATCQGLPLSLSESFDKGDGAGWDVDQTWDAMPVSGAFFANVATLDSCATVSHPAACSGTGLFTRAATGMLPALDAALLAPDQIVEVTFVSFTPTWDSSPAGSNANQYTNGLAIFARACEVGGGDAYYGAAFNSIGIDALGGSNHPTASITKTGNGGIGETLASTPYDLAPGDVLRFEVIGNSLTFKVNGSTILSASGDTLGSPNTGPALNPACSSAGLSLAISCVDVTAGGQGPFTGTGGWNTIKADDFSVVASV